MFRLEFLKLERNKELGNVDLFFIEPNKLDNTRKLYSTVIIGPNGTGKSFILKYIAEIFKQFHDYKTNRKEPEINFDFHLRYHFNDNIYEIISGKKRIAESRTKPSKGYWYLLNRPIDAPISNGKRVLDSSDYWIGLPNMEFPEKLISSSTLISDRFPFSNSSPSDFYQYLGVRNTSTTASTNTILKRTINNLYGIILSDKQFKTAFENFLEFLGFENHFDIRYKTINDHQFFTGNLNTIKFIKYYEEKLSKYANLEDLSDNSSLNYYTTTLKGNSLIISELVEFINKKFKERRFLGKLRHSSKNLFTIDLIDLISLRKELDIYNHLEKLNLLSVNKIILKKKGSILSTTEISAGEINFLISLIGIFATVKENSIILIDEPETSLHPNWQMKYVSFLKTLFKNYSSCHFVIATHSHFMVSDLERDNSSVLALSRDHNNLTCKLLEGVNTFGWSAENILLNVFNLPTTRNYFVADKIGEILELVSRKERNETLIAEKVESLMNQNVLSLSENDPLKAIWDKLVEKYGTRY